MILFMFISVNNSLPETYRISKFTFHYSYLKQTYRGQAHLALLNI